MIIDGHIHVGNWTYKNYASLSVDVNELNKLLDKCGISGAVLFPSDKKDNEGLLNQIKKFGRKKYWFFPWVNPKDDGWRDFLEKNVDNISGVKVHSSLDRIIGGITNNIYGPLLEFAQAKKLVMYVHCGRWQEAASYKFVLQMGKKYNGINFIVSHLGGDHEELKLQAPREVNKAKLQNVYFDISATRESWAIENAINLLGAEKIIFGSDYPIMHPKVALECVNVLNLTKADKELIYGKNLLHILDDNKKEIRARL